MNEKSLSAYEQMGPVTPEEISSFLLGTCAPEAFLEPAQQQLVNLTERLVAMNSDELDVLASGTDHVDNLAAAGVIEAALETEYNVDGEQVKAYQDVAALAMVVDGQIVSLTRRHVRGLEAFGDCRGYALAKILQEDFLRAFFPNVCSNSVEDETRRLRILKHAGLKLGENLFPGAVRVPVTTKRGEDAADEHQMSLAVSGVLPTTQLRERMYRFPTLAGPLGRLVMKLIRRLEPEFQNGAFDAALAYRLGEMVNKSDDFAPVLPPVLDAARLGR